MLHLRTLTSRLAAAVLALGLAAAPLASQAGQVITRFGGLDGLGIAAVDGDAFEFLDLVNGQPDGTNEWTFGGFTAQIDSHWTGALTGASLSVFSGGWGYNGAAEVLVNAQSVGQLSLGEDVNGVNTVHLDHFDLGAFLTLLTGRDTVEIRTVDPDDGGVLGYLQLTLHANDGGTGGGSGSVPEPASALLVAAALAAALAAGLRSRRDTL